MRNVKRLVLLLMAGLLGVGELKAHVITWAGNPWPGATPSVPLTIYFPNGQPETIGVVPESGELCTVVVENVKVSDPTLISAVVLVSPANSVYIRVVSLRVPTNHLETATVTADWYATGFPLNGGCTAVTPNPFTVPIQISDQEPKFQISIDNAKWINFNTGFKAALQSSSCLTGPWINMGFGQMFSVYNDMRPGGQFYQRSTMPAGPVTGTISDPSGNPLQGVQFDLYYGGAPATTDTSGYYSLNWLPYGMNVITISNPVVNASLNVEVNDSNYVNEDWVVDLEVEDEDTNVCDCTPWCAIGYGSLNGGVTPVYYSGGASQPKGSGNTCDEPVVTVMPPSGPSITIRAGTRGRQNSGPNPTPGTWTVTAVVCGKTKTATVDVP